MKRCLRSSLCALFLVAAIAAQTSNRGVTVATEQRLKQLLPATVFLDGENVPTQERNAALAQLPNGKIFIASLIDTTGYSSTYQEKYSGILLSQTGFTLGGKSLDAGAYGMGQKKNGGAVTLEIYNVGGEQVAEIATQRQDNLRPLKPLQIMANGDGSARLYLGPYYVSLAGR